MKLVIILLAGWSESGKDTAASFMVQTYGFQRMAFADAVKIELSKTKNIPLEEFCRSETKRLYRSQLIELGEGRRKEDPRYWAKQIATVIEECWQNEHCKRFVVSDWRNLEELLALQTHFGEDALLLPVLVRRPSQILSPVPHASTEYGLLGFPFWHTLHNGATPEIFHGQIADMIELKVGALTPENIWQDS